MHMCVYMCMHTCVCTLKVLFILLLLLLCWTQKQLSSRTAYVSWHVFLAFFFGSFILLAKSLTYSTASALIFLEYCYFGVILQGLYCKTRGVTRHGSVAALDPGFSPSLFKGFLISYWKTSSPLERPKSFQVLLALWVQNLQGRVVRFVNPEISPLLRYNQVEKTQIGTCK